MNLEGILRKTKRIGRNIILTSLASATMIGCEGGGENPASSTDPSIPETISETIEPKEPENVRINTPTESVNVNEDGSFQLNNFQPSEQPIIIRKEGNQPTFLYYIPPTSVELDETSPLQKFRTDNIKLTPRTTALSLVMLNPYLIGASDENKIKIAEEVLVNPKLIELASQIADNYENTSISLTPEVFQESCEILKDILTSGSLKTTSERPPFIRDDPNNDVSLVNTTHIYYGASIESPTFSRSLLLTPRNGIFDFNFWPPKISLAENTEITLRLPEDSFNTNITKGFNLEDMIQYPLGHSAKATYANTGTAITKLLSLAITVPNVDYGTFPTTQSIISGMGEIVTDIKERDVPELVKDTAILFSDNHSTILKWLYGSAEDNLAQHVTDALSIVADLNVALKVLKAADNVPFFYDLVTSPREVDYTFSHENGVLDFNKTEPDFSEVSSRIAFVSERDGNSEIYTTNPNGSDLTRITYRSSKDMDPSWSPDGIQIAFISDWDLYIMNNNGNNVQRLIGTEMKLRNPSWSPNRDKITFKLYDGSYNGIYMVDLRGGSSGRLTKEKTDNFGPSWSPDGDRIVFSRVIGRVGYHELYTMNYDGTDVTKLTEGMVSWMADWSPNGNKIAFSGSENTEIEDISIYTMNPDGSDITKLTYDRNSWDPTWSPDGSQIAFTSIRDGNEEIYVMNSDGTNQVNITNNPSEDYQPSWSSR